MGADTAVRLAEAGFAVALTARDQDALDKVARKIETFGVEAFPYAADLTDRAAVAEFAEGALERFGRCDVLCNIGIYQAPAANQLFMDTDLSEFALSFEADVIAAALLCQRAIPSMKINGGTIINMSSMVVVLEPTGTVQENGWPFAYSAAKAGIDRLAGILNAELGGEGVRAFSVEPGYVLYGPELEAQLRKYPGLQVSPPEVIGPAIVWLVRSPDADRLLTKRVNLPGVTQKYNLLPGWGGPGTSCPSA